MIPARKVKREAQRREKENLKFRVYLKEHADPEKLDTQFAALHRELFAQYDCSRCRNCCKEFKGTFNFDELSATAESMNMNVAVFVEQFLKVNEQSGKYDTKHCPCDFLVDGNCLLGDCKPDNCKKYPYTDQPGRWESLYGVLDAIEVCPVAYEIWERLKKIYNFR